jgi:hypothetical protein
MSIGPSRLIYNLAMSRTARVYEVLIASPGDVSTERQILIECIEDWNSSQSEHVGAVLLPRRWELDVFPEMGARAQEIINKQVVERADMLLGAFWHRLGTPTGEFQSGTAEEIAQFVSTKRPVSLYFSQAPVPISHDAKQLAGVLEYKARMRDNGVVFDYPNKDEFRRMVLRHLAAKVNVLLGVPAADAKPPLSALAKVSINTPRRGISGDVKTVTIEALIQNVSDVKEIPKYICIISVPKPCLTHQSGSIHGEVHSADATRRRFRIPAEQSGPQRIIYPGETIGVFCLDLGVDQLDLKGTFLAGDKQAALSDKVTLEVIVNEEKLVVERVVADLFAEPA